MDEAVKKRIEEMIASKDVFLFMKGSKLMPMCGFSARVVEILNAYQIPYETFDILQDPEIRQGVKDFANWPTIPQLYIRGEFIGGCDIVTELHESGELKKMLEAKNE